MARIRTVKPSFWGDDKVSQLSIAARFLFLGLISMADDDGRFLASLTAIAGYVYPNDDLPAKRLAGWLNEIQQLGLVTFYNGGRVRYGAIPKYGTHQRINRPTKSTLPAPPPDALFPE